MKTPKLLLLCALSVLCVESAFADNFRFRAADLPALHEALVALDGAERTVDQGPGNPPRVVREPYKFAGEVRARLAANLAAVADAVRSVQQKRDALIKQISGGGSSIDPKDAAKLSEFATAVSVVLEAEVALDLAPVPVSDLQLEHNAIPVSVLATLAKLRTPPPAK